mgnify:CR=1 FL=1
MGWNYGGDSEDSSVKVLYLSQPDSGLRREVWFSEDASTRNGWRNTKNISQSFTKTTA